jgi:hypothetical protein
MRGPSVHAAVGEISERLDAMELTLAGNVASRPRREPRAIASASIASFGLSTGMRTRCSTASVASPNAEQVFRIPLAPALTA